MSETNPKDAIASDKLPVNLWPASATAFGCVGLANGAFKYGRNNWRATEVRASIYVDAAARHLSDWFEGNESDPQDGVHNLAGALASLAILVDALCSGTLNDDRNYSSLHSSAHGGSYRNARALMEPHIKRLRELHAKHNPHQYTIKDNK